MIRDIVEKLEDVCWMIDDATQIPESIRINIKEDLADIQDELENMSYRYGDNPEDDEDDGD